MQKRIHFLKKYIFMQIDYEKKDKIKRANHHDHCMDQSVDFFLFIYSAYRCNTFK